MLSSGYFTTETKSKISQQIEATSLKIFVQENTERMRQAGYTAASSAVTSLVIYKA